VRECFSMNCLNFLSMSSKAASLVG
jgi:hypothetical protein